MKARVLLAVFTLPLVVSASMSLPAAGLYAGRSVAFDVAPGEIWQFDWSWSEAETPLTSFCRPRLSAFDATGKNVFSSDIGIVQQRVYDPDDLALVRWRVLAEIKKTSDDNPRKGRYSLQRLFLPPETSRITLSISSKGDEPALSHEKISGRRLDALPVEARQSFPMYDKGEGDIVDEAGLDYVLARREKACPELVRDGDRTMLRINGRTMLPRIFKTVPYESSNRLNSINFARSANFDIALITLGLTPSQKEPLSGGIWRSDGSCDRERVRKTLRRHLKRAPYGLFVLGIDITPPVGWADKNLSEIYRNAEGRFGIFTNARITSFRDTPTYDTMKNEYPAFSYTSEVFARDASRFLEELFAAIEEMPEGKAVVGVYLCGGTDGQWLDEFDNYVPGRQGVDHSDSARRRFAEFRRSKYGRDDVETRLPDDDEYWDTKTRHFGIGGSTLLSDYREFLARATTEFRLKLASAVKRGSGGRMLVGSYSPNTALAGYPLISQSYSRALMESPHYDFFAVVPSYEREHRDAVMAAVFDGTMNRRGKLYISELDLRSPDVQNSNYWGSDLWRANHTAATFRRKALFFALNAVTHGGGYHAYDMGGGWYATAAAKDTWRKVNEICAHARSMPFAEERVAYVAGERYWDFQSFARGRTFSYLLREFPRQALSRTGVPWNSYLVDELLADEGAELPKTVVFGDLSTLTYDDFRRLRERYARDARTLVWSWRPGYFTPDGKRIESELGLRPAPESVYGKIGVAGGSAADRLMEGISGRLLALQPYFGFEDLPPMAMPDPAAGWKTLACFEGTDVPELAVRRKNGCTEIYTSVPGGLTPRLCRNILRESGCRALVDSDELSGYGSGLFYIVAQSDGVKRFRLPRGVVPDKVLEGAAFSGTQGNYEVSMKRGEIFVLSVKSSLLYAAILQEADPFILKGMGVPSD